MKLRPARCPLEAGRVEDWDETLLDAKDQKTRATIFAF